MTKFNMTLIHERLARLETSSSHQSKKINEIHKALVGNGQLGLIAEWNQWKGTVKFLSIIGSILISLLGTAIGVLAYIR